MTPSLDRRRFLALGGLAGAGVLVGCGREGRSSRPPPTPVSAEPTTTATSAPPSPTTAPDSTTSPPSSSYWPPADDDSWALVAPAEAGWDDARLEAALQFAGERSARSVVLLGDGRIVTDRQWGVPRTWGRDVASVQKSVTATLVAIAEDRGLLTTDDAVSDILGAGWSLEPDRDAEARVTILHLLTMSSGLSTALRVVEPPGTVWLYNNDAYHQLHPLLEAVADRPLADLSEAWLWQPIGVRGARWVERRGRVPGVGVDAAGRPLIGLRMNAYDLARFGLLIERDGHWDGTQVVSESQVEAMRAPSTSLNPGYGRLWWRNGGAAYRLPGANPPRHDGPLVPNAPDDLVAALGAADQKAYVTPSWNTVLTRLGGTASASTAAAANGFDDEWWSRLGAARI